MLVSVPYSNTHMLTHAFICLRSWVPLEPVTLCLQCIMITCLPHVTPMLPLPYSLFPCLKASALSIHVYWGDPLNGYHEYSGMAAATYWLESFFGFYDSTTALFTKISLCFPWELFSGGIVRIWTPSGTNKYQITGIDLFKKNLQYPTKTSNPVE